MNDLIVEDIKSKIYEIRGKQVIMDSDLAKLYECKNGTKDINKAVKRNIERFPEEFYFQLSNIEYKNLKFQIGTSNVNNHGGIRKLPYVFTEQGIAMLSSVLHTEKAVKTSIQIINAFVLMRHYVSYNIGRISNIEQKVLEHDNRLQLVENIFDNFKEKNNHLFFKGEIYDAYSLLNDILNKAKKEIIIIDNYINKSLLDILSRVDKKIIIITNNYNNDDYLKYKNQYNNIKLIVNNDFHDRFIVIDRKELYHSGSSFKDLGRKCFEITKEIETDVLELLLNKIDLIYPFKQDVQLNITRSIN